MCSTAQDSLDSLGKVLGALASQPALERGAAGSPLRIRLLLEAKALLEGVLLDEVATLDAAGLAADDGSPTTASWLRAFGRLGRRDASAAVHQARALRRLPVTSTAMAEGAIGRDHASAIIKAKIASGLDDESFEAYETILVELAREATPDEVSAAGRHLAEAAAPDRDKQLIEALADRK